VAYGKVFYPPAQGRIMAARLLEVNPTVWGMSSHTMLQYNLNIQRELAQGTILTVGYVGSRGVHLLTSLQANPPLVCSFAQGPGCANPTYANGFAGGYFGFGTVGNVTSNPNLNNGLAGFPNLTPQAWSQYNSMLVSVNKRFSRDFQVWRRTPGPSA
jgi:hypothetical protein